MTEVLFHPGDIVEHVDTDAPYRIAMTPPHGLTIEKTGELAYVSRARHWQKYWVRSQTEMEDGRFVLVVREQREML
jgi:hypothetical protein